MAKLMQVVLVVGMLFLGSCILLKRDTTGELPASSLSYTECHCSLEKKDNLSEVMKYYTGSNINPADPALLKVVRDYFIDKPRPYLSKFSLPLTITPQAEEVNKILKNKGNGFFVECGGLDGERSSNTLWLENKQGWDGLLIEMDPSWYMQLRGKNRKCLSINACLSPETFPTKLQFKEHHMGEGRLVTDDQSQDSSSGSIHESYCFPFYSLMLALNRTHIDYFSLDVEGLELPILKTIPFDQLDITVLTVEFSHGKSKQEYVDFMASVGYDMVNTLHFFKKELYMGGNDFVFVKRGQS